MSDKHLDQDRLVQRAEELVSRLKNSNAWNPEVGKTQASRAIEVAQAAESLRLFVNWLRYQAARESERQPFWSAKLGQKTLAEALSDEFSALQKSYTGNPMAAVRLFMGYFRRALVGAEYLERIKVEG